MRVPADDDRGIDAVELGRNHVVGRDPRQDRLVVARRRVAEDHGSEPVDITLDRQRPGCDDCSLRSARRSLHHRSMSLSGSSTSRSQLPETNVAPTSSRSCEALRLHRPPETSPPTTISSATPSAARSPRAPPRAQGGCRERRRARLPASLRLLGRSVGGLVRSLAGAAEPRPGADDVEGRAAGARERARRRPELAGPDPRDRCRELRLEPLGVVGGEHRRDAPRPPPRGSGRRPRPPAPRRGGRRSRTRSAASGTRAATISAGSRPRSAFVL